MFGEDGDTRVKVRSVTCTRMAGVWPEGGDEADAGHRPLLSGSQGYLGVGTDLTLQTTQVAPKRL